MKKDLANVKRTRSRKYFWLAVALAFALLVLLALALIKHKPTRYVPVHIADKNQISQYLTNQLLPTIYNGAQRGEPFDVVITQDGLNDIIARWPQLIQLHNITLADPQVFLTPQQITLMATARATLLDLVLVIEVNPVINQQGLMNLYINNITLGAANITTVGMLIGDRAYSNWLSSTGTEPNNIAAQICRSLLNNEPFEPTFEIGSKTLRISQIEIMTKKIIALLTPVPDQPAQTPANLKHQPNHVRLRRPAQRWAGPRRARPPSTKIDRTQKRAYYRTRIEPAARQSVITPFWGENTAHLLKVTAPHSTNRSLSTI